MSCSSTPLEYNLVAAVALSEWFVLKPCIPAFLHMFFTMFFKVLCPKGAREKPAILFRFCQRREVERIARAIMRTQAIVSLKQLNKASLRIFGI